ncbi:glycosyltransferase family 4 protein [Halorientalis litorea]|uniref:glycosyltransferase family 4 protein n=1 Tax=Halorientalis litorea TaxID=2931977 RepID=UPI001FF6C702|nr:glycosyltransferase family 4 protein [Halorientalis litorea]
MTVGIYIGSAHDTTSQYIEKQLISWGEHLQDFEVDVFGSANLPESATEYFTQYKTSTQEYRTPYLKVLATYRECLEYIKNQNPDALIQLRNFTTHGAGVSLAGQRVDLPILTRYTGDHFNAYKGAKFVLRPHVYFLHNYIGRIPIRLSDHTIALGPFGKSELRRHGQPEENITILPPSPDTEGRFSPPDNKQNYKQKLDFPTNRTIILYVGKFIKRKGMPFFEEVVDQVTANRNVQFVIVGQGSYADHFREKYDDDTVRVEGYVDYRRIDQYYKAADIYIHPSPFEGIPLVVLEALSCGVPVVARDAGDVEFVTGTTYDDVDSMAEAIINETPTNRWENKQYFSSEYQKETLQTLVTDLLDRSN